MDPSFSSRIPGVENEGFYRGNNLFVWLSGAPASAAIPAFPNSAVKWEALIPSPETFLEPPNKFLVGPSRTGPYKRLKFGEAMKSRYLDLSSLSLSEFIESWHNS